MRKEDKNGIVNEITELLNNNAALYVTDSANLNADQTSQLRRLCFKREIKMRVVKNTLLKRAMESSEKDFSELYPLLEGPTSIMVSDLAKAPATLIKEFRKKSDKPILKGAYVMDMTVIGDDKLDFLIAIKSREELIGDIILALQSPANNVIGSLKSGSQKLAGIVKTLSEKAA